MNRLHHLPAAASLALALALAGFVSSDAAQPSMSSKLTAIDRTLMVSAAKVQGWHDQRDAAGPAYTGGPAWKKFMALIHDELKTIGMVDIVDHPFRYTRWYTTEFPDKSGWSFVSDGTKVDVASYGTQSGSTGPRRRHRADDPLRSQSPRRAAAAAFGARGEDRGREAAALQTFGRRARAARRAGAHHALDLLW